MARKYPTELPDFHLTKTHRKLLKHARNQLKRQIEFYVCTAIQNGIDRPDLSGVEDDKKGRRAVQDLKRFIRRAIERRGYMTSWQRANGFIRSDVEARVDRIMWIEYILENTPKYEAE